MRRCMSDACPHPAIVSDSVQATHGQSEDEDDEDDEDNYGGDGD